MNVIAWLDFKLTYYDSTVHRFNHYTMRTPPANYYYFKYSDYWPHLYCYKHNILADMTFFRCFMSNSGVHTESRTEFFIWTTRVDYSNSLNHDRVQVLSYSQYSLLALAVVGIEPATSRWYIYFLLAYAHII